MPLVTFFSVLERPGKNSKGVATTPLVRRGLRAESRIIQISGDQVIISNDKSYIYD